MANTINRQQLITDLINNGFERDHRFWHNGYTVFIRVNTNGHIDEAWEIDDNENYAYHFEHGYILDPVEYKLA